MAKTYDCYGGHPTLSTIGQFLLRDAPDFGDAIKEIEITLHFPCAGPAKKTLEQLLEWHNSNRANLPKITYRRKKGMVDIHIASELMDGRDWRRSPTLSLSLFERGVGEVIHALSLIGQRLKTTDAFDYDAFLSHCERARNNMPDSEDELQDIAAELRAADQAKRAAMSPWDKLGIDWEDFHPEARGILDDPYFWDCTDDFSPNGNDTGADLLEAYRDWLKRHKNGQPMQFVEQLAKKWGYPDFDGMDDDVRDEAAIALAFADIKLRSICDPQARELALKSIDRQRVQAQVAADWSHKSERLMTLDKLEAKLKKTDNKP